MQSCLPRGTAAKPTETPLEGTVTESTTRAVFWHVCHPPRVTRAPNMVGGRILRRPGDESPEIVLSPARGVPGASNQIVRRGLSHYREKDKNST